MLDKLSMEQIEGILNALPMEFMFVDENEILRYLNKGEKRKLKIPTNVLGKDIRACHKKETLERLERLVSDLKSGNKDEEVFWINYGDKILNRFIAVRGKDGKYLGMIEYVLNFKSQEKYAEEKKDAYKQA
jgi:uncharacterized protein